VLRAAGPVKRPAPGRLLSALPSRLSEGGGAAAAGEDTPPRSATCSFWPPPRSGEQGGECRGGRVLQGAMDGDTPAPGFFCRPLHRLPQGEQLARSAVPFEAVRQEFAYSVLHTVNYRMHWKRRLISHEAHHGCAFFLALGRAFSLFGLGH